MRARGDRRIVVAAVAVVGALLAACQAPAPTPIPAPTGEPVTLFAGSVPGVPEGSCFTFSAAGLLVVDARFGTAILNENPDPAHPHRAPVRWQAGFTARRVGAEVAVVDRAGNVAAITGQRYRLPGGFVDIDGVHAFFTCQGAVPK